MKSLLLLITLISTLWVQLSTSIPLTCASGNGVRAVYYDKQDFFEPAVATQVISQINNVFGTGKGQVNMTDTDDFSIYYSGGIIPTTSGSYRFLLESDDGSRMNLEGSMILTNFGIHTAANTTSSPVYLDAGVTYFFTVDFYENLNTARIRFFWSLNGGTFVIVPNENLRPCYLAPSAITFNCNSAPVGLFASYYNTNDFSGSVIISRTDAINPFSANYGSGSPDPSINVDNFSIRWQGVLSVPSTAYYRLGSISQNTVKIYIDDTKILDNATPDTSGGLSTYIKTTPMMYLETGKKYFIQFDFQAFTGTASFDFYLSTIELPGKIAQVALSNIQACIPPGIVVTSRVTMSGSTVVSLPVTLRSQPTQTVYVYMQPDSSVSVSPCVLIFTPSNWNVPQYVTASTNTSNSYLTYTSKSTDTNYNTLSTNTLFIGTPPTSPTIVTGPTCTSWGDPHLITFDGKLYDLYVVGDFYLVRSVFSEFVVQTRQLPCAAVSCNYGVTIKYYDSIITIYLDATTGLPRVYSNSASSYLGSSFTFSFDGSTYKLNYPNGIKVRVKLDYWTAKSVWYMNVYVTLPTYYNNLVRGLCGTYDSSQTNDYHDASGSTTTNFTEFYETWRVPYSQNLFYDETNSVPTLTTVQSQPTNLLNCQTPTDNQTITLISDPTKNINNTNTTSGFTPTTCTFNILDVQNYCSAYFLSSAVAIECTAAGVNTTALYETCVTDVMNMCDYEAAGPTATALVETCRNLNITTPLCQDLCNLHGTCVSTDVCVCTGNWTGTFCDFDLNAIPCTSTVTPSAGVAGETVIIQGSNFPLGQNITCSFGSKVGNGTVIDVFTASCIVPDGIAGGARVNVVLKYNGVGQSCGAKFNYTSGTGSLDPHFFGFHGEKMEVKRDKNAANQLFHLYCSPSVTITALFLEYPDDLLFMTRFWVRLGGTLFTLNLSTVPRLVTQHDEPYFLPDLGRYRLEIEDGSLEWDDSLLRVVYKYLRINFRNAIYLTESPYMNVEISVYNSPTEDKVTGIIGRTVHKKLTHDQFKEYIQFRASVSDVITFSCPLDPDLI